jgi:hypothetical protein
MNSNSEPLSLLLWFNEFTVVLPFLLLFSPNPFQLPSQIVTIGTQILSTKFLVKSLKSALAPRKLTKFEEKMVESIESLSTKFDVFNTQIDDLNHKVVGSEPIL